MAIDLQQIIDQTTPLTQGGITNKDLGLTRIAKMQLVVPPIREQKRFGALSAHVAKLRRAITESEDEGIGLARSLTQRAFSGRL